MDSATRHRDSFEDQSQKLKACEENLRRHHQLALAGRLVGATMHEVNNRLGALTNLIYLAKCATASESKAVEYLEIADDELRGLGEITSKSLGFIRVDNEARDIDLVELAESALHLHRVKISSKRINVQTRSDETVIAMIKRGEIFQVLTNLLLNAIDALPHSGSLHVRVILRQKEAIMTVADNGVGIPEAMRDTLFDSFKSSKVEGNGLGLWIVKEIIHNHRGRIQFRSSTLQGKSGTIFRVFLPINELVA
ncbi:sensor histidine kinase [Tunturiibacter gelidoferens]|uniref:histidine kinase n=1 Tax=Tunturiibacter gelidiferens TaxID=3069689 RepID=A0A9X0U5F3_9BACT|nr:ATP-binding protein [Edaphobacter lichenicola]MBB5330486.1 signal transduction histidine kinase [Edaphobacter lichenicola]